MFIDTDDKLQGFQKQSIWRKMYVNKYWVKL